MGKYKLHDIEHDAVLELELTAEQFGELKRFLKDLKTPRENVDYKQILERYNSVCKNLPPATRLTNKRRRAISRLMKDGYDLDELFRKAAQSGFLGGKNKEQWHANFDWILDPEHALKILEGNYSPIATAPSAPMTGNPFDEYG
ncbi:MAG: hypothetical protein NC401_18140 [Ruminococcus sp.]|nr:hypothetical protein [Ruminococcus sp.]